MIARDASTFAEYSYCDLNRRVSKRGDTDFDCDLERYVWNIGWPFPIVINDRLTGVHVGLFAYLILPFAIGVLLLTGLIAMI